MIGWIHSKWVFPAFAALLSFTQICCDMHVQGVLCVQNADCAGDLCDNGVCVESAASGTDSDTSSDSAENTIPGLSAVDILLVVDSSGSMSQEQSILSSSIFSLLNSLYDQMSERGGISREDVDVRVGVTSSDMGVSYAGIPYTETFSPHTVCTEGDGLGNNGRIFTSYQAPDSVILSIPVKPEVINCTETGDECPVDWVCTWIDETGAGKCTPLYSLTTAECPNPTSFLTEDRFLALGASATDEDGYQNFIASVACMSAVGVGGCSFEQPLAAIPAAFRFGTQSSFLREEAMTLIIVISDEDDCSLSSDEWHETEELGTNARNIACGIHPEFMTDTAAIYQQIQRAKADATGKDAKDSIMFAAIVGVPVTGDCQGFGDEISRCMDVPLEYKTMGDPAVVEKLDPIGNPALYYELSCERYENGIVVTQAYPAIRIVQLAQEFGEMGYVFSICNGNWTDAMETLVYKISARLF